MADYPAVNNAVTSLREVYGDAIALVLKAMGIYEIARISGALVIDRSTGALISTTITDEKLEGENLVIAGLSFDNGAPHTGAAAFVEVAVELCAHLMSFPNNMTTFMDSAKPQ